MKKLLFAAMLLLPFGLFADTLQEGATIQAPVIKDQFEKTVDITQSSRGCVKDLFGSKSKLFK
jgi:hypothetical protein